MNYRTNSVSPLSIGIAAAVFAIPQLLFFWLAPHAACRMTVYGFMTGYTLLHLLFCAFIWARKGMRVAAAPVHLSTVFVTVELAVCVILLAAGASPSAAALSLVIPGLIHFLAEAVLYKTLER